MGWSLHDHRWRPLTGELELTGEGAETPTGLIVIQGCNCGAVRQIEIRQGEAPKVLVTPAASD